eukprot:gene12300-12436_t
MELHARIIRAAPYNNVSDPGMLPAGFELFEKMPKAPEGCVWKFFTATQLWAALNTTTGAVVTQLRDGVKYVVGNSFLPTGWEIGYNHFVGRLGLKMPETAALLAKYWPESYRFHWGLGTLTHADTAAELWRPGIDSSTLCSASAIVAADEDGTARPAAGRPLHEELMIQDLYIVIIDNDPVVTYGGGIPGLAATASGTGASSHVRSASAAASQSYSAYLKQRSDAVASQALGSTAAVRHYYTNALAGFVAGPLTRGQVAALQSSKDVRGVFPNRLVKRSTISTPSFLGLDAAGGAWSQVGGMSNAGENIIIAVIDTGIWPEAPSFSDRASGSPNNSTVYGPLPGRWQGTCDSALDPSGAALCNLKLIGCRHFTIAFGGADRIKQLFPEEVLSCREVYPQSHGTHVAATAGGNQVTVTATNDSLPQTMTGIAPRARLAMYKIFWGSINYDATVDVVAAMDAAVGDGAHIISMSLSVAAVPPLFSDPTAIAAQNAAAAGVSVVVAAGNEGPDPSTLGNWAQPWVTTVAASTHNRGATANVRLGNTNTYTGAPSAFWLYRPVPESPIILAESAAIAGAAGADARRCFEGTLDPPKVAGRIVLCDRGVNDRVEKSAVVAAAGGVGMLLVNVPGGATSLNGDLHSVTTIHLASEARESIRGYITAAGPAATAALLTYQLDYNAEAPRMADFSSRGPLPLLPDVLKPDIAGVTASCLCT